MDRPRGHHTHDRMPTLTRRQALRVFLGAAAGLTLLPACSPAQAPAAAPKPAAPTSAPAAPQATAPAPSSAPATNAQPPAGAQAAAPAQQASSSGAVRGTVRIATPRGYNVIEPLRHLTTEEQSVFHHLFDGLTELNAKLELRPRLAESWEAVNPTTWRFRLRQGVKFSNGEAFDAESAKFSIESYANLQPPYFFANLWATAWPPSVEIENASTILVHTPQPQPSLPRLVMRMAMMPPVAGRDASYADKPIGTGTFKLVEWKKGQQVVAEANPTAWRGTPKVERLTWQSIPDAAARIAAMQAGEVDLIWDVPNDRASEIASSAAFTTLESPIAGMGQYMFNFRAPSSPIADPKVRKALTYAIDGQAIVTELLQGKGKVSVGPAPATSIGAIDAGGFPARDVAMAKKLLAEAGHGRGLDLTMIFNAGQFNQDTEVSEALIGQLSEAGVNVKFEQVDSAQLTQRRPTPTWDIAPNGNTTWTGEAPFFVNQYNTNAGYKNANVDGLLEQANAAGDTPKRVELIQQALKAMWAETPYLWSFDRVTVFGASRKLSGAELLANNWLFLHNAQLSS